MNKAKPYHFCVLSAIALFFAGTTMEFGVLQVALSALLFIATFSAIILLFNAFIGMREKPRPDEYITKVTLLSWWRLLWKLEY